MKQILVDANVLISFLTDRNLRQREKADDLLRKAAAREHRLILHNNSIVEMIYVLTQIYHEKREAVAEDLSDLLAMPGVISKDEIVWSLVLEQWPATIPALGDAILATVAISGGIDSVATFDRDLAKRLSRQGVSLFWPLRGLAPS